MNISGVYLMLSTTHIYNIEDLFIELECLIIRLLLMIEGASQEFMRS